MRYELESGKVIDLFDDGDFGVKAIEGEFPTHGPIQMEGIWREYKGDEIIIHKNAILEVDCEEEITNPIDVLKANWTDSVIMGGN